MLLIAMWLYFAMQIFCQMREMALICISFRDFRIVVVHNSYCFISTSPLTGQDKFEEPHILRGQMPLIVIKLQKTFGRQNNAFQPIENSLGSIP